MIRMINGEAYDTCGTYKRKIIGVTANSMGLCYMRQGLPTKNGYGKECMVLASSVDVNPSAKEYIDKMFYLY